MRLLARRSKSSRSRPCQNWSGPRTRVLQRVCASHGSCRRSTTTHPRLPDSSTRRPKAPRRLPVASPETPPSHRAPTRSACCDLLRRGIRHESCAEQNPPNRTMQGISPESSMSRGIPELARRSNDGFKRMLSKVFFCKLAAHPIAFDLRHGGDVHVARIDSLGVLRTLLGRRVVSDKEVFTAIGRNQYERPEGLVVAVSPWRDRGGEAAANDESTR